MLKAINPSNAQVKRRFFQFRRSWCTLNFCDQVIAGIKAKAREFEREHGTAGYKSVFWVERAPCLRHDSAPRHSPTITPHDGRQ